MSARGARYIAQQSGEKYYSSGTPCKRGHTGLRHTATGSCIECRRENEYLRYHANPKVTREKIRRKYHANAVEMRKKRREFYRANAVSLREEAKVRSREWRRANPNHDGAKQAKKRWKLHNTHKVLAYTVARRLAKVNRTPAWLTPDDFWLIEQAYELAALRTKMFGFQWHVDHIVPLQGKLVSGLHTPSNLQVIPGIENVSKANRFMPA